MGGTVTVVLKEPSGIIHKMARWTNTLPSALTDPRLFSDEPDAWIADYMKSWLEMRQDFEAHREDGQFQKSMTLVYFPGKEAVPSEYGIILIDLQAKQIHTMQSYCTEPYAINWRNLHQYQEDPERINNIKGLIRTGAITKAHMKEAATGKWLSWQTPEIPAAASPERDRVCQSILASLVNASTIGSSQAYLEVSPPGWRIIGLRETLEGGIAFLKALDDSGVAINDEERTDWGTWAKYRDGPASLRKEFGIPDKRSRATP